MLTREFMEYEVIVEEDAQKRRMQKKMHRRVKEVTRVD